MKTNPKLTTTFHSPKLFGLWKRASDNWKGPLLALMFMSGTLRAALIHQWTFNDGTAADSIGAAHAILNGSASITNGQLRVDGNGSYASTGTIFDNLTAKTLLVWERLAATNQGGGCPFSVETPGVMPSGYQEFDAIDYGERTPNQWMSGSETYHRSLVNNGGSADTSLAEHMLAITYSANGAITIYRDGVFYADAGTFLPVTYTSERYLMGRRHDIAVGPNPYFNGWVSEARVYDTVLDAQEIAQIYSQGPASAVTTPVLTNPAILTEGTFRFEFTNAPSAIFTVLGATNLGLPASNWEVLGTATEGPPGAFQFTEPLATNYPVRFFRVRQ